MAADQLVLDVDFCRSLFPSLADGLVYMENAGGSYVPQSVIDCTVSFLTHHRRQPYAHYEKGAEAKQGISLGETKLAEMLDVETNQLIFGANSTVNFYVLAQALRTKMSPGDEIVVSHQDHEANIGCWQRLSETGIVVREWKADATTGLLSVDDLRALLSAKTKVVCFTHASNVVAATNDVGLIAKLVHEAGALVCVDGVAYTPHSPLKFKEWDVDFYGFSLYKVFGPHLGVLYCKKGMEKHFRNQNHFFLEGIMPAMLNPGGRLYTSVASTAGVVDYIETVYKHHYQVDKQSASSEDDSLHTKYCKVFGLFEKHEEMLSTRLIDFLKSMKGVRVIGPAVGDHEVRMPTIAFVADGVSSQDMVRKVAESNIAIAASHFYSYRMVETLGIDVKDGVARVSMVHYNTLEEVDRLCTALRPILSAAE
ncbi:uncharacterized protein LOC135814781 [Sycon ciliatum]|uniref:uncharacterized protein LOC135814781 n=1 Tax=Sycon ciliatum TaxID=27933 RepID=UPI0020AA125A|eukprot:scpid52131/ scgid34463/ Probable cysteine desulfurase &gt; Probable cysteine desulfurase